MREIFGGLLHLKQNNKKMSRFPIMAGFTGTLTEELSYGSGSSTLVCNGYYIEKNLFF